MFKRSMFAVAVVSAGLMVGCGSSTPPATQPTETAEAPKIPIPPDSPFAKVSVGMGYDQVIAILGQPTTPPYTYQTGKAWIPFHYGGDNWRMRAHWKGEGAITFSSNAAFSSGSSVMDIGYDPTDKGFEPGT